MQAGNLAAAVTGSSSTGRRLIVVDVENLVGGACICAEPVTWARQALRAAVPPEPGDQVVIGTSRAGLLAVGCNWPKLRYVLGPGTECACLALLEVLSENVPERFDQVVLASGDGIFAEAVALLSAEGVRVTVAAHREGISRRLEMAASVVAYLDGTFEGVEMNDLVEAAA
jgi:hypothetical protein